jgi:protein-tyrosine-phosphatase
MNVLFIFYANIGRSQVAEAYFRTLSKHHCVSAGIAVNDRITAMKLAGRKLKDNPNQSSIQYIRRELGLDIAGKERQQLVPDMIAVADLAEDVYRQVRSKVEELVAEIGDRLLMFARHSRLCAMIKSEHVCAQILSSAVWPPNPLAQRPNTPQDDLHQCYTASLSLPI